MLGEACNHLIAECVSAHGAQHAHRGAHFRRSYGLVCALAAGVGDESATDNGFAQIGHVVALDG